MTHTQSIFVVENYRLFCDKVKKQDFYSLSLGNIQCSKENTLTAVLYHHEQRVQEHS